MRVTRHHHREDLDLALPRSSHTFGPVLGSSPPQGHPPQCQAIHVPPLAAAAGKWDGGAAKEDIARVRPGTRMSLRSSRSVSVGGGGGGAPRGSLPERPSTAIGGGPTLAVAPALTILVIVVVFVGRSPLGATGRVRGDDGWGPSIRMCLLCRGGICRHLGGMSLRLMELVADVSV